MGLLSHLLFPWGLLLQGFAIIHFIRRRPDIYWIYIILFLGPLGALIYIFVEAVPDIGLLRQSFKVFRVASALASLKRSFEIIRRRGITKNSATFIWTTAGSSWHEPRSTKLLLPALIRSTPFTGAVFAPYCSAMLRARYPTWNESSLKNPTMISIARQDCLPTPTH